MRSTLWKVKYKCKRNPGCLLLPGLLMLFSLLVRLLFTWKSAGHLLTVMLWISLGVAVGLWIGRGKKKGRRRMKVLPKWSLRKR